MRSWLREKRCSKGLTMKAIADGAGISESFYSQIENGTRNASVPVAKKIAAALGFPWERFFE